MNSNSIKNSSEYWREYFEERSADLNNILTVNIDRNNRCYFISKLIYLDIFREYINYRGKVSVEYKESIVILK